jgi:hypothetical protein
MPYNSETGQYERRVTTILDETPDGDTVNSAVAVKIDAAVDDGPTDLNHHKVQGGHYPATSTATGSRYLHQSPAGVVSWRDGVPADQAAQADASNVTDGAAWRAAIGAEVAGAVVTEVVTHNADASAHGLDTTVWPVAQGGTGASTAEDARAALDVYSKGAVDAALGGIRTGTAHAPQSIIKAALGQRPDGWTTADCDAPVASLSHSGNAVTVEAGLQVAYADSGSVQLSEVLAAPQSVDLSAAADGTSYIYADLSESGTFSGFGATTVAPEVGIERSNDVLPPFSGYTLEDWGTVSAVNEIASSGHAAWKCLDGGPASAVEAAYIGAGGSWTLTFTRPRTVKKLRVYPRAYTSTDWTSNALGSANVLADGTQVATISKASYTGSGDFVEVDINSVCSVLTISSMLSTSSGSILIGVIDIELGASVRDLYNPAELVMCDGIDNPIRRVYIGTAAKSSGAITSVQGFALGDRVRLAATGTILDNPFGGWHVQATQGTALLSATPAAISGVTVNTTPVVVRR